MKHFLAVVGMALAMCPGTAWAQAPAAATSAAFGKIALAVVMPDNSDGLEPAQITRLEGKITQLVTHSGLSASGYGTNFVVYPVLTIAESNVVEGGMQNITVTTAELNLYIKQVDNNLVFATISKRLKGSGSSKALSLANAISQIQTTDPEYQRFIEQGKQKILAYYQSKCDDIIRQADASVRMNQFDQALALLVTVPAEATGCFTKAQGKAVAIYKAYSDQHCSELLLQAKGNLAANRYDEGLTLLSSIDPGSKCFTEAKSLMVKAEMEIDVNERKTFDAQLSLEKQRINAIRDIAKAYYANRPSVTYHVVVR
jgi:hypothetical protein